jgi:protein tyrosine/serine phosphatase
LVPTPDAYWVTAIPLPTGRLLAGEYPSAKDPAEATRKLGRYLDAGVTTFIDLTEDGEYRLRPYAAEVVALGVARGMAVTHQRHPIPDLGAPAAAQMVATLDAIDAALARGQTVYVHCFGGVGRTGTVVGCWLVRHGLSGAAALAHIAARRAGTPDGARPSPETPAQRAMVIDWQEGR